MGILKSIEIHGPLEKRLTKNMLNFYPGVNLLIGSNGCGKSTIIQAMRKGRVIFPDSEINFSIEGNPDLFAFDFEKDNPRIGDEKTDHLPIEKQSRRFKFKLASKMSSHGQFVKAVLRKISGPEIANCSLLMDEPEQALDIEGLMNLITALKNSPADQIIIATHSPFLILQPDFHIIEMVDGYRELVQKQIQLLASS